MVERQFNLNEFLERGLKDELLVMESLPNVYGGTCWKSTKKEDIEQHIDFWWNSPKKGIIGVDVKGMNKAKRTDEDYDDTLHWVEAQNVKGKRGWIYGDAEYIAFRTKTQILFVKRIKLVEIYENEVKNKEIVYRTPKDFYIPYKRLYWGRDDISFKIPNDRLKEIADFSINY